MTAWLGLRHGAAIAGAVVALVFCGVSIAGSRSAHSALGKEDLARIHGRIQFVESFPDYKVQEVAAFPDLRVKRVGSLPDSPGEWQIVDSFPDYKIQRVDSFPDFTIQFVDSFPGVP